MLLTAIDNTSAKIGVNFPKTYSWFEALPLDDKVLAIFTPPILLGMTYPFPLQKSRYYDSISPKFSKFPQIFDLLVPLPRLSLRSRPSSQILYSRYTLIWIISREREHSHHFLCLSAAFITVLHINFCNFFCQFYKIFVILRPSSFIFLLVISA